MLTVCGSIQPFSANRAAVEVAHAYMRSRRDVELDDYADLARIPPFNAARDDDPDPVVTAWRKRIGSSDTMLIAAPEYAGALAGTIKNALDWIVGSGELYVKPVAVMSAGTTGGLFASQMLIQTLTWQGAHVVAQMGIAAPRTKSDADGRLTDDATIAEIERLTAVLVDAPRLDAAARLELVRTVVGTARVDIGHIAPLTSRLAESAVTFAGSGAQNEGPRSCVGPVNPSRRAATSRWR